jgi:hypothetical protein
MGEIIIEQPHFDNRTYILFCQETILKGGGIRSNGTISPSCSISLVAANTVMTSPLPSDSFHEYNETGELCNPCMIHG